MAYALYYEAKRKQPLTEQEKAITKKIIEKYCSEYPFKRKVEDFCMYDEDDGMWQFLCGQTHEIDEARLFLKICHVVAVQKEKHAMIIRLSKNDNNLFTIRQAFLRAAANCPLCSPEQDTNFKTERFRVYIHCAELSYLTYEWLAKRGTRCFF